MTITRRALALLGSLWLFPGLAIAQSAPRKRPPHVADPKPGEYYWCVAHPFEKQRPFPVKLPWRGRLTEAVWGDDLVLSAHPYIATKANPYNLFRSRDAAERAIVWDWNHPRPGSEVTLALAPAVADEITRALGAGRVSRSLEDGGVPGLFVARLERATAQQLFGTLATALNCTVLPNLERDEPAR